ncbi:TPM domain-containing protein [Erythrobacter sp. BLCC-B19]|uniref:TPM domain-containing protein n=1 Tax=Erythrobacter sp. BLCC-B19 TaxID=3025315 RepID=UPI00235E20E4|nr:TPM domain-containing protein [Erythrobacter sp. BLCC-B19]WDA41188.1 TPM domain-containing protein [Erythrobacter sp. BLCC-B19]
MLLGLALFVAACDREAEPARPGAAVIDQADVLSPEAETALGTRLRRYWDHKETAIVVATVPSLKGETIEAAANRMFNDWGIGDAETNRGVLLLIAPAERRLRIEVGCGLETVLPSEVAAQIIREAIRPRFSAGDLEGGTNAGVDALIARIDTANTAPGPVSPRCRQMMKEAA